ncbi:MAG: hypothetical protein JO111_02615 [Caulobacteraceae bacterium]|nr:hypothetical protein [Caulobacteraceae bacterium]
MRGEKTSDCRVSRWGHAALLGAALLSASVAKAADYPTMAPLDQYLMDRSAEIAMAKSAAPPSISEKATVLVLTPRGYETAVTGSNGFVCAVERAWMSQYDFPGFWNPRMRGPLCFNPPAVRSILPYTIKRTELVLAGRSKAEIIAATRDGIDKHTLPPLEAGALTYMMSKQGYLNDAAGHWVPHLMFYFPKASAAEWGADLPGAPPMLNPQFLDSPESLSVLMVPVKHWSDGSPAPGMQ